MQKKNTRRDILDVLRDAQDRLGTVVDERWWVEEYRPAYNTGGYYDQDIPEEVIDRSHYFPNEEEARAYLDSVECTDPRHRLRLRHQKCYERLERRWI